MTRLVLLLPLLAGCSALGLGGEPVDQAKLGVAAGAAITCAASIGQVVSDPNVLTACRAQVAPAEAACRQAVTAVQALR